MFDTAKETVNLLPLNGSTIRGSWVSVRMPWWRRFSYRVLASRCVFCLGDGDLGDLDLCERCLLGLPWLPEQGAIKALFEYRPPISTALIKLKFQRDFRYAAVLGGLLGLVWRQSFATRLSAQPAGIVPIPLHPHRLRERGFNQVTLLARFASQIVGYSLETTTLQRVRDTVPQTRLDATARRHNLCDAFTLKAVDAVSPVPLSQSPLILLDDVVTTGATLEAARAAWPATEDIQLWAVAKAIPANITNPMV